MDYTLYHNPNCGTSRNVLEFLREAGIEPIVVQYLKTPPDIATLRQLQKEAQQPARYLLRSKEALCTELGLDDETLSDEATLQAIADHPKLLNRPVLRTPKGVFVCRPSETVKALLP